MQEYVEKVGAGDGGQRLDTFWQACLDDDGVPRTRIQAWIRSGRARIDGQDCTKPATRIWPGQTLTLRPDFPDSKLVPCEGRLHVMHADEQMVVIDKEPGLTVHPAPSVSESTLVHRVAFRFPTLLTQSGERPGVVHRLDKDTSGLIVLGLSESARLHLSRAFSERSVFKEYLALVAGVPPAFGTVTLPLGRHPDIKTRMAIVARGGRPAETRYRLVWSAPDRSASLVRARILTGRTHQIRVHMAALGHPILGDAVYADADTARRAPRQMLHSWRLRMTHPGSGQEVEFCAPPPRDFVKMLHELVTEKICLGLTGAAGSGKSAVAEAAGALGAPVFSADRVVAESYVPGGVGAVILNHHFASRFNRPDGGVDKDLLQAAMAESTSLRREVERLIHPLVRQALRDFRAGHVEPVVLAEIPLLFEAGLGEEVDLAAAVYCPDAKRHERLMRRGWDQARIARVDSWQWSQERKMRAAHLVVDNSGSLDDLKRRSLGLICVVRARIARRRQQTLAGLQSLFENPGHDTD